MNTKSLLSIIAIIVWEVAIYYWSVYVAPAEDLIFQLAARYSARTSFFLFSSVLVFTGLFGLLRIFSSRRKRFVFLTLSLVFAVNHLIHFFYLVMNHISQDISLLIPKNGLGTLGYIIISLAPIYLQKIVDLTKKQYWAMQVYLLSVSGFFVVAYLRRLSEDIIFASPASLFKIHLTIITILIAFIAFRAYSEQIEEASKGRSK
ncbi:MAG: hypothetical protein JXR03_01140 [Cyclobacteriaceae bacterium]